MKAFRSQPHKLKIHQKTLWQLTERIKNGLGHEGLAIFYAFIFLVKQAENYESVDEILFTENIMTTEEIL